MILTLRTDKPVSEIGLFQDGNQAYYHEWEAHRQLAETIHMQLEKALKSQKITQKDIKGIVIYKGPGSFTGLRIGMSVANALAFSLNKPVVAVNGGDWQKAGIQKLEQQPKFKPVIPEYGSSPHVTRQKK